MTVRSTPTRITSSNQCNSSFFPSQFASFCEMGKISDLIFENRQTEQKDKNSKSKNIANYDKPALNQSKKSIYHDKNKNQIQNSMDDDTITFIS